MHEAIVAYSEFGQLDKDFILRLNFVYWATVGTEILWLHICLADFVNPLIPHHDACKLVIRSPMHCHGDLTTSSHR